MLAVGSDEQKANLCAQDGQRVRMDRHDEPDRAALQGPTSALLKTKAVPQDDGTYKITGTKIFISAGDHDVSENIIHLVLAKMPDSPDNVKGISLFIVPKFLVNEDGSVGERNSGQRAARSSTRWAFTATPTCVMKYDEATGYSDRREGKGSRGHVHHDERRASRCRPAGTRAGRSRLPERGRLRRRTAARAAPSSPKTADADAKADSVMVHPDVRRMLMDMASAFNEGRTRAHLLWGALCRST